MIILRISFFLYLHSSIDLRSSVPQSLFFPLLSINLSHCLPVVAPLSVFAPLSNCLSFLALSHNLLYLRPKLCLRFSLSYSTSAPFSNFPFYFRFVLLCLSMLAPHFLYLRSSLSVSSFSFLSLSFSIAAPLSVFASFSLFVPLFTFLYLRTTILDPLSIIGFSRLSHAIFLYLSCSFYRPHHCTYL